VDFLKKLELSNDVKGLLESIHRLQKKYRTVESGVVQDAISALRESHPDTMDVEVMIRMAKIHYNVEPWPGFWCGIKNRGNMMTEATIKEFIKDSIGIYPNVFGTHHWKMRSMILEFNPKLLVGVERIRRPAVQYNIFHKDFRVTDRRNKGHWPPEVQDGDTLHLITDERGSICHCRSGQPVGAFLGGRTWGLGTYAVQPKENHGRE